MAAPITHIVLTEKVFDKHFSDKNRKDFCIGTVFSDIRHLKVVDRKRTHSPLQEVSLKDVIQEKNSFTAGLKFHSLVDDFRERFIKSKDIYSLIPESKYKTPILKLLEDELNYDKVKDWNKIVTFFDDILPEELDFNIKEKNIRKWHDILQRYFSKKPNKESIEMIAIDLPFPKEVQKEIINLVKQIRPNKEIKQATKEFYNNFESSLS